MDFQDEDGWGRPGFIVWAVGLAFMLLTAVFMYFYLPPGARIPMQVNANGQPINFAEKGWVLFSPVVVA
ncbi:MAG: hypothetical protein RBU21_16615, partial [FCB group bacterium]|nr:hypothetical protein [FCB group bacterium]